MSYIIMIFQFIIVTYFYKLLNCNIFQKIIKNCSPSWFGLPIFINEKYKKNKKQYINFLENSGIETRPIISGNFINQPAIKKFKLNKENKKFPKAQKVEDTGFFIGLHTNKISDNKLSFLVDKLLKIENFK